METIGLWQVADQAPARLEPVTLEAERDLEEWIAGDPGLLERGLVVVGNQIRLDGGRLDLLALDPQGRWVVIEIKRERLRREVLVQAMDYASCLHAMDSAQLREHCDAYLRSRPGGDTVEALLNQRGRSLADEADGREIVLYLVGTAADPGLDRMVGYLASIADLSIRIVTFSAFRDVQGRILLARKIHESTTVTAPTAGRSPRAEASLDSVTALANQNGLGPVLRTLLSVAAELGFVARPYAKSVMFAPQANRTRCLFVVGVERRSREPGYARSYLATEAFEQFYGIPEADVAAAVGQTGNVMLDQAGAERWAAGLRRVLTAHRDG